MHTVSCRQNYQLSESKGCSLRTASYFSVFCIFALLVSKELKGSFLFLVPVWCNHTLLVVYSSPQAALLSFSQFLCSITVIASACSSLGPQDLCIIYLFICIFCLKVVARYPTHPSDFWLRNLSLIPQAAENPPSHTLTAHVFSIWDWSHYKI